MASTLLVVLAFILLAAGLIGAVVPALPGPPLSYAALLLLQLSGRGDFSFAFLLIWALVTAAVLILDNFLPALMVKRFGGSRYAEIGSLLGLVAGIFLFPPWGLIAGPFLGAFVGELIHNRADGAGALKVSLGAFLAFLAGTGIKLIAASLMLFFAVRAILS